MKVLISFASSIIIIASCTNTESKTTGVVEAPPLYCLIEKESVTRTTLSVDDEGVGTVYWKPSDCITVFFGTEKVKYFSTNEDLAINVVFDTTEKLDGQNADFSNIWGLYPYNADDTCNGSSVITAIPSLQKGIEDSFDTNLFPMLAHSTSNELHFNNVCGGIKFSLSRNDIRTITFKGNNNEDIAGRVKVVIDENGKPFTSIDSGEKVITLKPQNRDTFTSGVDYYMVLLPCNLNNGFTMTFETLEEIGVFNYCEGAISIKRSIFSRKENIDSYASFTLKIPDGVVDLGLSVLWAECNVGANTPEEDGDYYAWGETETHYEAGHSHDIFGWKSGMGCYDDNWYKWRGETNSTYKKYCADDSLLVLETGPNGDDVASLRMGSSWRIPTDEEWTELRTKCTWKWATQNGVSGEIVTAKNGNSIFLPAAGEWLGGSFITYGEAGNYWSSSRHPDMQHIAWGVDFWNYPSTGIVIQRSRHNRSYGHSVRPIFVRDVYSRVTGISLDKPSVSASVGENFRLCATVKPDNATVKTVVWSSTNPTVASVDDAGNVTVLSSGYATIIATTVSGGFSATCEIVAPELEHIDLGLSVEWATYNIGARNPEETGDFYAWGETASKSEYNWTSYYYCNGTEITLTKYCTSSTNGNIDNVTTLDARDDVAQVRWGINWRMPTKEEFDELISECTWSWTILNNVYGYCITGPNHNSIFLPVTGYIDGSSLKGTSRGYYWSSTLDSERPTHGKRIIFNSDSYVCAQASRYYGFTVRPVYQ